MLVAKNQARQYDDEFEEILSRRRKSEKQEVQKTQRSRKTEEKRINKRQTGIATKNKIKFVFALMLTFTLCIGILLLNANISKLKYELLSLNNQSEELLEKKNLLEVEIDKVKQSDWIEEAAINSLGLKYPAKDQIIHVDVQIPKGSASNEVASNNGVFKSLLNKLVGIIQ